MNFKTKKSGLKTGYEILVNIGALFLCAISVLMLYTVWEEWNQVAGMADHIWQYTRLFFLSFVLTNSKLALFYFSTGRVVADEKT